MRDSFSSEESRTGIIGLHNAACRDSVVEIKAILESGHVSVDKVNRAGMTALHAACFHGRANAVVLLLEHGADINAQSRIYCKNATPLHLAIARGHKQIARVLVDAGADVTLADHDGFSPVDLAVEHKQWSTLAFIQQKCSQKSETAEALESELGGVEIRSKKSVKFLGIFSLLKVR